MCYGKGKPSLPSYISDIVNVGIQQEGVTDKIPNAIRESEFNKLLSFADETDKKTIQDAYTVVNKSSCSTDEWKAYQAKYPVISNEAVCVLKDLSTPELNSLEERMTKPIVLLLSSEAGKTTKIETDEQFKKLPDTMVAQAVAKFIKGEYDAVGIDTATVNRYILLTGVKMLGVSLLGMLVAILVCYLASSAAASIGRDLKSQVFKRVVSFSNTEFDKFSTASLITRSTNDVQQVQMLTVLLLRTVLYAPILGIGAIIKLLGTNTSMSWIIGLTVGIVMIALVLLFTLVMPRFKLMQKLVDKLNLVTREILTGLPVIRAFSRGKYEEGRFDKANKDLTKTSLFVNRVMSFMTPAMMLIMNTVAVLIVWTGANSVNAGQIQVGDIMAYIQYTMLIVMAFLSIATISTILPRASVSAVRIDEILSTNTIIQDPERKKPFAPDKKGVVEFDHVSFRYPEAEEDVLHDITFTANPGQTTAIMECVILGTLAEESRQREVDWLNNGCNVFYKKKDNQCRPLSFWTEKDIYDYINLYNIKIPSLYEMGFERNGCMFCGFGIEYDCNQGMNRFERLAITHPKMHMYLINNFKDILDECKIKY